MARKKVAKKTSKKTGWLWKFCAVIAAAGGILEVIGASTSSWFNIAGFTSYYKSTSTGSHKTQLYGDSNYGLYLIYFNQGAEVEPWYSRVSYTCSGYNQIAETSAINGVVNLFDSTCSTNCVAHFKTRCSAYKQLSTMGLVSISFLIGSACLTLTAVVWVFVFGKAKKFLQFAWLLSGILVIITTSYMVYLIRLFSSQLNATSFFPPMTLGYSVPLTFGGSGLCVVAGLLVAAASWADDRQIRKEQERAIIEKEAGANLVFELPPPGNIISPRATVTPQFAVPGPPPPAQRLTTAGR